MAESERNWNWMEFLEKFTFYILYYALFSIQPWDFKLPGKQKKHINAYIELTFV